MRRFLLIITVTLLCGTLISPASYGRDRRGGNERRESTSHNTSNRNRNNRLNNSNNHNKNHAIPSGNRNNNYNRPAPNRHHNVPVHNNPHPNYRPQPVYNHHSRPHHNNHVYLPPAPSRHFHNFHHHGRPVPPPAFRPRYHISPLNAILGITLGTALNISLNTLRANNHAIAGYANNCIYLNNVNALNLLWPDATLYYNNGVLQTTTFSYATSTYSNQRYNMAYNNLVAAYGAPVATNTLNNGWSATWWGYDNRYVTLEYQSVYSPAGGLLYYTNLIMGN